MIMALTCTLDWHEAVGGNWITGAKPNQTRTELELKQSHDSGSNIQIYTYFYIKNIFSDFFILFLFMHFITKSVKCNYGYNISLLTSL